MVVAKKKDFSYHIITTVLCCTAQQLANINLKNVYLVFLQEIQGLLGIVLHMYIVHCALCTYSTVQYSNAESSS